MNWVQCPRCNSDVIPNPDGSCPHCQTLVCKPVSPGRMSTVMFNDHPSDQQLGDYLDAKLIPDDDAEIDRHIEQCEACEDRLKQLLAAKELDDVHNAQEVHPHPRPDDQRHNAEAPVAVEDHKDESIPDTLGKYRIEQLLGEGGFGRVYRARDSDLNRLVAIKVLKRTKRKGSQIRPLSPVEWSARIAEFKQEAETLGSLDHPHIATVYDMFCVDDGRWCIVSKYVDGGSLADKLNGEPLPIAEAVEIAATVAEALDYAHERGLVHRDVKPANILLDHDGKVYVVDFGLALTDADYGNPDATRGGTPYYMSPEQTKGLGHLVEPGSDIFSLGAVLYEMLTGRRPFPGPTVRELYKQIQSVEPWPLRPRNRAVSKELEHICLKALSKRRDQRYRVGSDMAEALRELPLPRSTTPEPQQPEDLTTTVQPAATPIITRGLRAFGADDAGFFLQLLPGQRDAYGIPVSVLFWKTAIDQTDSRRTFRVGLIYGPSGCGKSSFVKAGLLPRLSEHVVSIYVSASADQTETKILSELQLTADSPLPDPITLESALSAVRRGDVASGGCKFLIVLDQFEQWLHANGERPDP